MFTFKRFLVVGKKWYTLTIFMHIFVHFCRHSIANSSRAISIDSLQLRFWRKLHENDQICCNRLNYLQKREKHIEISLRWCCNLENKKLKRTLLNRPQLMTKNRWEFSSNLAINICKEKRRIYRPNQKIYAILIKLFHFRLPLFDEPLPFSESLDISIRSQRDSIVYTKPSSIIENKSYFPHLLNRCMIIAIEKQTVLTEYRNVSMQLKMV